MAIRVLYRAVGAVAAAVVLMAAMPAVARVSMSAVIGFDGACVAEVWTPVAVTLTNDGAESVEGTLRLRSLGKNELAESTSAAVNLPAQSRKRYFIYARLESYTRDVEVALSTGSHVLASKRATVDPANSSDVLIVTVGNRAGRLNYLFGEKISGRSGRAIQVGSIEGALLPDRPAAYEGVDVLVIGALAPDSAGPRAREAIAMWVASGGILVVSSGPDYRRFTDDFYSGLLPVTVKGSATVAALQPLVPGSSTFPAGPAAISASTPKPGSDVQASAAGWPLLASHAYGGGSVVFVALDVTQPPFRNWDGQTEFWKSILQHLRPAGLLQNVRMLSGLGGPGPGIIPMEMLVEQAPSVRTPSFAVVAVFLLAYLVVLVPVNYCVLNRRRRLEMAWVTTPAIVLVFCVGAYVIGYTMKGGHLILNQATIVEATAGSRYAGAVSCASIFSPARRNYEISLSDPRAVGRLVGIDSKEVLPAMTLGETSSIKLPMAMWSGRVLQITSGLDLGGTIDCSTQLARGSLEVKVSNNTSIDLRDCAVHFGGATSAIGDLRRGGTASTTVSLTTPRANRGTLTEQDLRRYPEDRRFDVYIEKLTGAQQRAYLVGWSDTGAVDVQVRGAERRARTCYVFRLVRTPAQ